MFYILPFSKKQTIIPLEPLDMYIHAGYDGEMVINNLLEKDWVFPWVSSFTTM